MDEYLGIIKLFAGSFAPRGWLFCHGQLLSVAQTSALFSILGTTYGGDGKTTFALPDLRSRVPVGAGQGPGLSSYLPGDTGGGEKVVLSAAQLPAHTHATQSSLAVQVSLQASAGPATQAAPANHALAAFTGADGNQDPITGQLYAEANGPLVALAAATAKATLTGAVSVLPNTGRGDAVPVLQPYTALQYIICVEGLYAERP